MIDESLSFLADPPDAEEEEEEPKRFYGVTIGRVISQADPMFMGRVQVQLPFIDDIDLSPWARVMVPISGILAGAYFIPKFNDEVVVAFEHGDINVPYVIGSLWNVGAPPPFPNPLPQIRAVRTPLGNQIVFTEAPPTLTLQNAPTPPEVLPAPPVPAAYQTLALTPAGISATATTFQTLAAGLVQFTVGGSVVTITPGGVSIASAGVLSLQATAAINITAGGTLTLIGKQVLINPVP
jgi:hypothetical protein